MLSQTLSVLPFAYRFGISDQRQALGHQIVACETSLDRNHFTDESQVGNITRDVPNLGLVGEVVTVKAGFARNYLVPKGLALVADPKAVRKWEHAQRLTEHAKRKAATEAEGRATALNGVDLTFPVRGLGRLDPHH